MSRHKPTLAKRAATRPASDEDYEVLGQAVVKAILSKQKDVMISLPYFVQIDGTFPKGVLEVKTPECNVYRAKAFKLADWLYAQGHLPGNAKMIVAQSRLANILIGEANKLIDTAQENLYNERLNLEESTDDTARD